MQRKLPDVLVEICIRIGFRWPGGALPQEDIDFLWGGGDTTATVDLCFISFKYFFLFCLFFFPFSAGLFSARLLSHPGLVNEPV